MKFKRIWLWEDTVKKIDNLKNDGETRAHLVDDIINFADKHSLIIENRQEREKRLKRWGRPHRPPISYGT